MYKCFIKRFLDIIISLVGIVFLLPFFLVISILIGFKIGYPVFFRQQRVGKNEKTITILKFRTMTNETDDQGQLLSDDKRLTGFGEFLRSSSLDELPELFNILAGELSLIGPRPLLVSYLPYYNDEERKRYSVRGGLIPPEVLYENIQPTWNEQFEYEIEYAKNVSFLLDFKILICTLKSVLKRDSVNYGSYIRKSLIEERCEII